MSGKPTESECLQLSEVLQGACVMPGGARGKPHRDTATRHDNPVTPRATSKYHRYLLATTYSNLLVLHDYGDLEGRAIRSSQGGARPEELQQVERLAYIIWPLYIFLYSLDLQH